LHLRLAGELGLDLVWRQLQRRTVQKLPDRRVLLGLEGAAELPQGVGLLGGIRLAQQVAL
jgi:hypothetical protein